jgi:radical SAM superfamily enzyme YgiQ (UPF0313 family)
MRSPEKIINEIKFLKDKFLFEKIDFLDDTFTVDKKRVEEICNLIKKEKIDISWSCGTRVELFDKKMAFFLKKAGCNQVLFGLESANQKSLDFMKKGFLLQHSKKAIINAKNQNIKISTNFILGIPGENIDMIRKTIDFPKKYDLSDVTFSVLTPYPGTEIYNFANRHNILLTYDWSKFTPFNPIIDMDEISIFRLKNMVLFANFKYNLKRYIDF